MKKKLKFILKKISILLKSELFYIGLIILLSGIIINQISSFLINKYFNKAPLLNDLIFTILPHVSIPWAYHIINIIIILIFSFYAFVKKTERIPYFLSLFGIFMFFRGIFMILTPFGNPSMFYNGNYFLVPPESNIFRFGVYPSGHAGTSFLAFLLSGGKYKALILGLCFLIIITLFVSRGHYSIDIISGIIFAYAYYCLGEKYLKNKLTIKKKFN
ncbi:MAG: hypothetical protein QW727_02160 [Candidatus Pacearchaeota archaeon]